MSSLSKLLLDDESLEKAIHDAKVETILSPTGYTEFATPFGTDMCCAGWDGVSTTCACGTTNVAWSYYRNKKGNWEVYAEEIVLTDKQGNILK